MSHSTVRSFFNDLLSPEVLWPNLIAATLMAMMNITLAISLGSLIFTGPLAEHRAVGIAIFLVGTAVGGVLVAAGSGFKGIIAGPRSAHAPILATMAVSLSVIMTNSAETAVVATVTAAILCITVVNGVFLYAMGQARLGDMVRYIPYPVMAGFFAGIGYLLVKGGVSVAVGPVADLSAPLTLLGINAVLHILPALIFALLFYFTEQRVDHWLLLPGFLLVALGLFYGTLIIGGFTMDQATAAHWLSNLRGQESGFLPVFSLNQLALVEWGAIVGQWSVFLVVTLLSMIILLLDVSGIEIILDRDLDPNHELKTAGLGNMLLGPIGGCPVIHVASDTAFTYKLGGDRFFMALVYGLIVGLAIWSGPALISMIPTWILGGLLLYLGIIFLVKWVWKTWQSLPRSDYLVLLAILAVVVMHGILEGVAVGVGLSIVMFVHNYSQLSVIKSQMSGLEHRSNIDRHILEQHFLDEHGDAILIMELQGFLFFGTASQLLDRIQVTLGEADGADITYLILDFKRVDAIDTSAVNSFTKLMQVCRKGGQTLLFTGCGPLVLELLSKLSDNQSDSDAALSFYKEMDEGMAWSEEQLLRGVQTNEDRLDPVELLTPLLDSLEAAKLIAEHMKMKTLTTGHMLFKQGDPGDGLYFLLSGALSIMIELPGGKVLHVRTFRAGAVLGEMAIYTGEPRSASAMVEKDGEFAYLSISALEELNCSHPDVVGHFHAYIVKLMAERLSRANKKIAALSR